MVEDPQIGVLPNTHVCALRFLCRSIALGLKFLDRVLIEGVSDGNKDGEVFNEINNLRAAVSARIS